jgi:RNA polymerase sigma-70 factor (ECF subfamily)
MDDRSLLAAVASGSDAALKELFDRHAPWVAARLRRALPIDAVEDVVQETFVAVWKGSRRYNGGGEVGAWIWGIARRQAALWYRANGKSAAPLEAAGELFTSDHAASSAQRLDLSRAISQLGGAADLVQAVYLDDYGLEQVADRHGVPVGTVKSRLFAARRRLRALLTGEDDRHA